MKKILLTGSGGFIGCNLIRQAIHNQPSDYSFISIDKVSNTKALDNIYTNKNHKFYIGNICDSHLLDVIFQVEQPDIVIHGAEDTSIKELIPSNIQGTQTLLNACKRWNSTNKFIYLSTDKVYGTHVNKSSQPWTEESVTNPIDMYAASKVAAELFVKTSGVDHIILRLANSYGARQSVNKLIPSLIKTALLGSNTYIYGNKGSNSRDWIYIQDTCSAIMKVLESGLINNTYNISSSHEFSDVEVYNQVCKSLNKEIPIKFVDWPEKEKYLRRASNSDKLRSLGWKPELKFKDGIDETVKWNLNNQWHLKQ